MEQQHGMREAALETEVVFPLRILTSTALPLAVEVLMVHDIVGKWARASARVCNHMSGGVTGA